MTPSEYYIIVDSGTVPPHTLCEDEHDAIMAFVAEIDQRFNYKDLDMTRKQYFDNNPDVVCKKCTLIISD